MADLLRTFGSPVLFFGTGINDDLKHRTSSVCSRQSFLSLLFSGFSLPGIESFAPQDPLEITSTNRCGTSQSLEVTLLYLLLACCLAYYTPRKSQSSLASAENHVGCFFHSITQCSLMEQENSLAHSHVPDDVPSILMCVLGR